MILVKQVSRSTLPSKDLKGKGHLPNKRPTLEVLVCHSIRIWIIIKMFLVGGRGHLQDCILLTWVEGGGLIAFDFPKCYLKFLVHD